MIKKFSLLLSFGLVLLPCLSQAAVIDYVRGYILLQVEEHGEAWYVDPDTDVRYYLGRPDDAFSIMRERGLGITDANLAKIPTSTDSWTGDTTVMQRVTGKIVLQVEAHGEAWYIYPANGKRYYLGRPDDAFSIMRNLGLGITNANLETIATTASTTTTHSSYTISTTRGNFAIQLVTLSRSTAKMITDTGNEADCSNDCTAKSLADYVAEHGGVAGIHGTYFCPPDYSSCATETNTFNPPVYNTNAGVMINENKLPFHNGPLLAMTTTGSYYYFHRTEDFGSSVAEFEERTGATLQAAIANYPSLIEASSVIVSEEPLESSQLTKGVRGGIGYNSDKLFLVIASSATVEDLAAIFAALGADYAMNLDGGGTAALYSNGTYHYGPGRLLPNAILFK